MRSQRAARNSFAFELAAFVDALGAPGGVVEEEAAPGDVAVALDDGVGFAMGEGLFGEKGGVDSAVDDDGAAGVGEAADLVAAEGVAGVDADADDVAGRMVAGSSCSMDSSTRMGSPITRGVAAARTKSQRGVMTAVPNELSLGLTR